MRLAEDKIKQAILHPDLDIRQRAIGYFAKSNSIDCSVMPLVIQAVETFGRPDAYYLMGLAGDLPQTAATVGWVIDELNDEQTGQYRNYPYNLAMVLLEADCALLLDRESEVLESPHFPLDLRASFSERLRMLSWDEATCWRNLETFCEEGKDADRLNEIDLPRGRRIAEALARYGAKCEEKVHALLGQTVDDYRHNPMNLMEPLAVRLAGQARLESAVPLIIAKLMADVGDITNEECAEAWVRIGTPAVLAAVAEAFPGAPYHFRLYASNPLENIHSDLAVEKCLALLGQEEDDRIRIYLANALLSQFASEGIDEARRLLEGQALDFGNRELRDNLVETCDIMGATFPEIDEWRAARKREQEEHWRRMKELEGDRAGLLRFALEKLTEKKLPGERAAEASLPAAAVQPAPSSTYPLQLERRRNNVGRNDRCPCGSGKKFKNCCLRKTS